MFFLKPDMHKRYLIPYHMSSKAIIPMTSASIMSHLLLSKYEGLFHCANILNFGFHSYVSTSCIITDYVKHPKITTFARISNFNCHALATFGLLNYVYRSTSYKQNN